MILLYFFLTCLMKAVYSDFVIRLNSEQPYWVEEFSKLDVIIEEGKAYSWSSWFQYLPLNSIVYSESFGALDNNCYHLFSSVEKDSKYLNFIHYDCLELQTMKITKSIQFIGNDDLQYSFEFNIQNLEYENQWYYFQLIFLPQSNKFQIIIIKNEEILKDEILNVVIFSDVKLIQKIGGNLLVEESRLIFIEKGRRFSSFPGKILPIKSNGQMKNFAIVAIDFGRAIKVCTIKINNDIYIVMICDCKCLNNPQNNLGDQDFHELNTMIYNSNNPNCNSFVFSGWFKIKEVIQSDVKMTYQFIKLSSNFQSSQLSNQNLSPFQLFYLIQQDTKKLIITSYSYQFPSVRLDFTNNPFLITREFNINHDIQLWHLIYVKLVEDDFQVNIKFYDKKQVYEYSTQMTVYHFHQIYYKLQLGNCLLSKINYLNIFSRNLYLFNCNTIFSQQNCHYSCEECDGPTNQDCLSCSQVSQRIYLPDYKQCICPYFTIDDYSCKSYSDFQWQLISNVEQKMECKYGQFEIDGLCYDCPGTRSQEVIICLDCLLNPKGWSKVPFCQTYLYLNQDGSTSQQKKNSWIYYFTFNGIDLELCVECSQSSIIDLNNINQDINFKYQKFKQFCSTYPSSNQCYQCSILYCKVCSLLITGEICLTCERFTQLIDGQQFVIGIIEENTCMSPYYFTSTKECRRCSINNCLHCFEYVSDDLTQCTLYKDFKKFVGDENLKVGCALCEDGYVYDFQLGMCLYQSPKIDTCLRSYINQDGIEICTLSSKQDFSIAREIINCEQFISNCLQCFLTSQSILRCIICKEGYTSTTTEVNGRCYINKYQYAKISVEGDSYQKDAWMQRIQSFLGSFLPNSYFYPKSNSYYINEIALSCQDGYGLVEYRSCIKYCNSDREECKLNISPAYFYCHQCPLDSYKNPQRVQKDGKCVKCSPLCQFCELRTLQEISLIQPNFIVNENNEQYSKQCIKPQLQPNVILQPQQQIPIYCLNQQCANNLLYEFYISRCAQESQIINGLVTKANINYLNQIGVQAIIIQIQYPSSIKTCPDGIQFNSIQFKQNIFSLRTTNLTILGNGILLTNQFTQFQIENFDVIYMSNFTINIQNIPFYMLGNTRLKFTMKNINCRGNQLNQMNKFLNSEQFQSIDLVNITIFGIVFIESSFFKIESQQLEGYVSINQLIILNCTIINSDIFSITNSVFSISIEIYKLKTVRQLIHLYSK